MRRTVWLAVAVFSTAGFLSLAAAPVLSPSEAFTREDARKTAQAGSGALAPVYGPLAGQIVEDYGLAEAEGIGIDLGGGSGTLILELCKRTRLHWVDADINPHVFPIFLKAADEAGFGGRVSAIFADAQALPFRDNYARIVVSRGSVQFWEDKPLAFREIYRVLAPGGAAYVGRGFSRNLPAKVARAVREKQKSDGRGGPPPYDPGETAREFESIMKELKIQEYRIDRPTPPGAGDVNYGVWVGFHKEPLQTCRGKGG